MSVVTQSGSLAPGVQTREAITCVAANTDYPGAATIPAWATRVVVFANNAAAVAQGEATTAAVGVPITANTPRSFGVDPDAGDGKIHVQSPTAGTVVQVGYYRD